MRIGRIFWFTGLSGSGKSTIAGRVSDLLKEQGVRTLILDGDDIRRRLHADLGFTKEDIKKNNTLISQLCLSERQEWDVIFVPVISPYSESRAEARKLLQPYFYEVYCNSSLEKVMLRDVKGLYAKAKRGEIDNMIGFSEFSPYEPPPCPDIVLSTESDSIEDSSNKLLDFVLNKTD